MSAASSPSTGQPYGVQRVCAVSQYARSTFYTAKVRATSPQTPPKKRGPKPLWSDKELLAMIRADLEKSPFSGEGHRKVWARLKFGQGVRASRARVLRLMRENHLLSPHRSFQGKAKSHDGEIITHAPNEMWGTDGTKVFTLEEGWCWIFGAVEHWNAECMGWHVAKKGDRFAALEAIAMGVQNEFGSIESGAARGLALRMDNGSQYLSERFQQQIKAWGIAPSFGFLREPETNGVIERFWRTLKEQAIYGKIFLRVEDVRRAVRDFVALYNSKWGVEKNGFVSPKATRATHESRKRVA